MGLLERALKYKKQLNAGGKETLIDRIKGPAESGFNEVLNSETVASTEIDDYSLPPLTEISVYEDIPERAEISVEADIPEADIILETDRTKTDSGIEEDDLILQDEEIILLSEDEMKSQVVSPKELSDKKDIITVIDENFEFDDIKTDDFPDTADGTLQLDKIVSHGDENSEQASFNMPDFNDYAVLYEILKELNNSDTVEDIYASVIFTIMGQLGVSSVSIISPSQDEPSKWSITESTGIKIPETDITWEVSSGILEILNSYRGVIDVEDLKDDISLRDDYYRFISVNSRLIAPIISSDMLIGAILVGEKIDAAEFIPAEMDFIFSVSEAASSAIAAKIIYDNANTELLGLRIEQEILSDVEIFQNSILSSGSFDELEEVIRKNFYSLGIESYALFLEEEWTGDYYPAYFDSSDSLGLSDSGFRIKKENRLPAFLLNKKSSIILENYSESSVIVDTFGRGRVEKMTVFISYPFIISGKLSGFITIFRINQAVEIIDVDIRMQRITRFIFPYIYRFIDLDPEKKKFSDLTGSFYSRIEYEINKSAEMNIPLSIISLSVKNYKRFYDRFGRIETVNMFEEISHIIKSRLYAGDFSVRVDRNRFIIVLQGKDKKYSSTFSTIMKNEITGKFNTSDFKLLVTFITAVFPDDGKDLFSLLEIID